MKSMYFREYFCSFSSKSYYFYILGVSHLKALLVQVLLGLGSWMPHLNSLWPSDATWCPRSGSTLAQVMACCLMAPSHYMNQCWLNIKDVSFTWEQFLSIISYKEFENYNSKTNDTLPRGQWVNTLRLKQNGCHFQFTIFQHWFR